MQYIAILGGIILLCGFLFGFLYKNYKDAQDEIKYQAKADSDLTDPLADVIKRSNERNERKKIGS